LRSILDGRMSRSEQNAKIGKFRHHSVAQAAPKKAVRF
jgi:hypothetical protein